MLNQVVLVGRLTSDPEAVQLEGGHKKSIFNVAVPRSYKNSNGEYETDFIRCVLWDAIATSTAEYCHKGDIVGIKGRIQVTQYEENNDKKYLTEVVAEKVTFLSSKKQEEAE
ncbi:MAG: single-stranded DNA-binding protein [Bacilli bacterium]|nr:single-stranded DNA-binding protein [Bacilli bacterium]